jgi:hypothetical protein
MDAILKLLIFLVIYLSADVLVEAARDLYGHHRAPVAAAESTDELLKHRGDRVKPFRWDRNL